MLWACHVQWLVLHTPPATGSDVCMGSVTLLVLGSDWFGSVRATACVCIFPTVKRHRYRTARAAAPTAYALPAVGSVTAKRWRRLLRACRPLCRTSRAVPSRVRWTAGVVYGAAAANAAARVLRAQRSPPVTRLRSAILRGAHWRWRVPKAAAITGRVHNAAYALGRIGSGFTPRRTLPSCYIARHLFYTLLRAHAHYYSRTTMLP